MDKGAPITYVRSVLFRVAQEKNDQMKALRTNQSSAMKSNKRRMLSRLDILGYLYKNTDYLITHNLYEVV